MIHVLDYLHHNNSKVLCDTRDLAAARHCAKSWRSPSIGVWKKIRLAKLRELIFCSVCVCMPTHLIFLSVFLNNSYSLAPCNIYCSIYRDTDSVPMQFSSTQWRRKDYTIGIVWESRFGVALVKTQTKLLTWSVK